MVDVDTIGSFALEEDEESAIKKPRFARWLTSAENDDRLVFRNQPDPRKSRMLRERMRLTRISNTSVRRTNKRFVGGNRSGSQLRMGVANGVASLDVFRTIVTSVVADIGTPIETKQWSRGSQLKDFFPLKRLLTPFSVWEKGVRSLFAKIRKLGFRSGRLANIRSFAETRRITMATLAVSGAKVGGEGFGAFVWTGCCSVMYPLRPRVAESFGGSVRMRGRDFARFLWPLSGVFSFSRSFSLDV